MIFLKFMRKYVKVKKKTGWIFGKSIDAFSFLLKSLVIHFFAVVASLSIKYTTYGTLQQFFVLQHVFHHVLITSL